MKIDRIAELVNGKILVRPGMDVDITCAFAADLMSDILVFAQPQMLMVTGLVNPQAVRTAEMADLPVILFVRSKSPQESMVNLAREVGIGLLLSPYTMYETCGLLYAAGLPGLGEVTPLR